MITATTVGLMGEHIAAASILSMGWRVGMAQQDSVDLLAWNNSTYIRVQVKSASPYECNKGGYQFQLGSGSKSKKLPSTQLFDMIALVAVDQRRVKYLATEQVQQFTKRCARRWFEDLENEIDSFKYAIEIIEARNGLVKVS